MYYTVTVFNSQFDNKTHKRFDFEEWPSFEKFLYKLAEQPLKGKKDAQLISPATYEDGTTRANRNVLSWGAWAAVDVDDHEFKGDLENELLDRFGQHKFICYSTASSTRDLPKFRLVFPLTGSVDGVRIRHFWYALNTDLGDIGDKQTKDLSRMYYIPGSYIGAYNFIFSNHTGYPIDPEELMAKYPYEEKKHSNNFIDRLPPEWAKQVIEHRKSQMDNHNVVWSSYHDCPFWPKKLASDYMTISNTGWYSKMYQIMVAIAGNAVKRSYPITTSEIAMLCKEFDRETGNWYENRPMEVEADRALEYVYRNG